MTVVPTGGLSVTVVPTGGLAVTVVPTGGLAVTVVPTGGLAVTVVPTGRLPVSHRLRIVSRTESLVEKMRHRLTAQFPCYFFSFQPQHVF